MFVTDIKTQFYDLLIGQRVLLLVHCDVDALAACRILQYLFQCDNILYTLVPIRCKDDIPKAIVEHGEQIKYVVMLNCGGGLNILEFCEPPRNSVIFVADSHRPVDVYNIYNDSQIRLLMNLDAEQDNVPALDDIFRDDMDESDEDDENDIEEIVERRREKRKWLENRQEILFEYHQFSYYGRSTAHTIFDLSWRMSKDSNEVLWWAIVGLCDQYINRKVERDRYVLECGTLQGHMSRHNRNMEEDANSSRALRITFDSELNLNLLKHWSLIESIRHTPHFACHFKLWQVKGQKKLQEFLADLGVPLTQCRQKFLSMDMHIRQHIKEWIFGLADKYHLSDVSVGAFSAHFRWRCQQASDVIFGVDAILAEGDFLGALDALSWTHFDILEKGIARAKQAVQLAFKQVQAFLETGHVISVGSFLYGVIEWNSAFANKSLSNPSTLLSLAYFLQEAYCNSSKRGARATTLPLVLVAPYTEEPEYNLIAGIPPKADSSTKNLLGQAFVTVSKRVNCRFSPKFIESNVALLGVSDSQIFFDELVSLLS